MEIGSDLGIWAKLTPARRIHLGNGIAPTERSFDFDNLSEKGADPRRRGSDPFSNGCFGNLR